MSREAGFVVTMQFQRNAEPARVKKPVRTSPLRLIHVLAAVAAVGSLFFGVAQLHGFLLTWETLDVRSAEVVCPDPAVRELVRPIASRAAAGNILLLDASRVKAGLEACPWVKEAHVRKVFPSSLAVDITPRRPAAILDAGRGFLLDRDNALIEPARPGDQERLPLFHDDGMFAASRDAKLALAWACWDDLDAADRERVRRLDVTRPDDVVATFRDDPVRLRLGAEGFARKIAEYRGARDRWTAAFGPLEYVDLRFPDRIYLKAAVEEE